MTTGPYHTSRELAIPVRSCWRRWTGWPRTSVVRRSASSTSAHGPTARVAPRTPPGTSRAPATSTGSPTSSIRTRRARSSCWPDPTRSRPALGRLGVGGGTTVVLYDDTASLYAARAWWSLRVYGLESCRILDGGLGAWVAAGHELSRASLPADAGDVRPRGRSRGCGSRRPTSAACSDRRDAVLHRRPGPGRVPRLRGQHPPARAHPGSGERAGLADDRAGQRPVPARRGAARRSCSRRT